MRPKTAYAPFKRVSLGGPPMLLIFIAGLVFFLIFLVGSQGRRAGVNRSPTGMTAYSERPESVTSLLFHTPFVDRKEVLP